MPVEWAAAELQGICAVQGNLDNWLLRAGGPGLDRTTRRLLAVLAGGPFIFNLGHGVLPGTPVATLQRLVDLVHGWTGEHEEPEGTE